ncbi:MAG: pyridoxamine 5'-phosphate oxidase family protein [Patescibacteria group bacterium]
MNNTQSKSQIIDLIREKSSGTHIASFITVNAEGVPCVRPMATQEIDDTGCITFMTSKESKKVHEIKNSPKVTLSYTAGNDITFVSLTGHATFNEDREKIRQIWNPFHEAWFDGPSDPRITLIEVTVHRFEYWDYTGGKIGAYTDMALSAITGKKADGDQNEVFTVT